MTYRKAIERQRALLEQNPNDVRLLQKPAMLQTFSDADFDQISFHDVHVYGFAAVPDRYEIRFDVDYLVEWLCPAQRPGAISFRISPATLVFENACDFEAAINTPQGFFTLDALKRSDFQQILGASVGTWQYELLGHEQASVRVRASGFRLYLRAEPELSDEQAVSFDRRGGVSFAVPE